MPLPEFDNVILKNVLERFLETSFNAIVITDTSPGYKIVYANPSFCNMTGYTLEELIGKSPRILQGKKTNHTIIRRLKTCLDKGLPFHGATTNYRKNGEAYPVEWNISPVLDENGTVTHYISIQKDLSQLKDIVTRLKNSNTHFSNFLRDISSNADNTKPGQTPDKPSEQKKMLTEEILDNSILFNSALRTDENIDLFGDSEFFDCSNGMQGILGEPIETKKINAVDYCRTLRLNINTGILMQCITDIQDKLELLPYSHNKDNDMKEIAQEIQDMANEIFYLDDFTSISSVLAELAHQTTLLASDDALPIIIDIYQALLSDLNTWINTIFIDQNAEDIHMLDASIISSVRQLLILLK